MCKRDKALTQLLQALASSSNNKYTLLCLQLHTQGHVFLLTMNALGCLCDQLLYIIFKLSHVYMFTNSGPQTMVWSEGFPSTYQGMPQTEMLLGSLLRKLA